MSRQIDMFTRSEAYPSAPGYKVEGPSREAARKIAPRAGSLRAKVLNYYTTNYPRNFTADEIAKALNLSVLSSRPRLSELRALGWLEETAERRPNESGCMATAMRASRQAMEVANG